ncbi:hypothetical protein Tco_0660358 [Tanacetum coccineum]
MEQPQSSSSQQITPAIELVPLDFQVVIGRCNNKTTLLNIPCPYECRIVGQILKDYALSSVLTSTADVPAIYIQLVWMMVKQVLNANDIICFMVEKENIIYTLDMFRTALKLPTETAKKPFIPPTDFPYIKEFLKIIGYQGPM